MPRSRPSTTPKKKSAVAGKVKKPKRVSPRKRNTKVKVIRHRKPPPVKYNKELCQDWLEAQSSKAGLEYDPIDEDLEESSDENESLKPASSTEPVMSPPAMKVPIKKKVTVNLVCEWMRCKQVFPSFTEIRQHVLDSHLGQPFPTQADGLIECRWDLCHFTTDDEPGFRRHFLHHIFHSHLKSIGEGLLLSKTVPPCVIDSRQRNTIADYPVDWSCNWEECGRVFVQIFDFIEHMKMHVRYLAALRCRYEPKEKRVMRCGWIGCSKEYPKAGRLVEHVRSHTNERMMACPNCGSTFTSYTKFYAHFYRQGDEKKFQCAHCFKYFFNEDLLSSHMYIHVNSYKCTMCDMTCPSPSALTGHMRHRHLAEKPFKCDQCDYACVRKVDLERHLLVHETNVYECDEFECNFSTESLFMMRKHDREVHLGLSPNVYGCHCCSKSYGRGNLLSQHLIKVHGFQLPSGHSRFTFSPDLEGIFRLQTMRMESLEVTQAIMSPSRSNAVQRITNTDQKVATFKLSAIEHSTKKSGSFNINIEPDTKIEVTVTEPPAVPPLVVKNVSMPDLRCSVEDDTNNDDCYEEGCSRHVDAEAQRVPPTTLRKTTQRRRAAQSQQQQELQMSPFKSIQDFSVMQRYLGKEHATNNEIKIEVTTLDEAGEVIDSNTVKAEEFYIESETILGL